MRIRTLLRRSVTLIAGSTLLVAAGIPAAGPVGAASGDYDGYAHGSVIHVDAVTANTTRVADLEVGVSNAAVDSAGLKRTLNEYSREIIPADLGNKHSRGHSSIAELGLVHAPDARNQLVPFEASSVSPGGADVDDAVLSQTVAPLVHVDVLRNVATSRWNADTCVIGEPIATGEQHVARAQVLEQGADDATDNFDGAVAGIHADSVGPDRAATSVISMESLYVKGSRVGLQSLTTATLAPVTLLQGTPNEFTLEFSGPAFLRAIADGGNGGAAVEFRVPLVTIIRGDAISTVLPGQEVNITVPATGDAIASVKVGVLAESEEKGNGTGSSAIANVVEVKLLDVASQNFRGATVAIGHMEASTNVPAGGIDCPLPVTKSANPPSVSVDDLFTITMAVHNPFACPLTNVTLVDDSDVRKDARFEFIQSTPKAISATGGTNLSEGKATWSLGTIAPGATKQVKMTMQALNGAGKILDTATATGSLGNCLAGLGEADADVTALAKVKVPVEGKATLSVDTSKVLGGTLPKTGVPAPALAGLALLGVSSAVAAIGRRRGLL